MDIYRSALVALILGLTIGYLAGKTSREPAEYVVKTSQEDPTNEASARARYRSNLAVLEANERRYGPAHSEWTYNAQFGRLLLLRENERILTLYPSVSQ